MFHLFRKPRIAVPTDEGSVTFLDRRHHQTFHSTYGPIEESRIVFVQNGLLAFCRAHPDANHVRILEMGFGTGLNALLTAMEAPKLGIHVSYTSYERYPLRQREWEQLSFPSTDEELLRALHTAPWGQTTALTPFFQLEKRHENFRKARFGNECFDVVYYDAFSPDVVPELWSEPILSRVAAAQPSEGLFVTYTVKGTLRRTLQALGYKVERLPGTSGKRQVLQAVRLG